MSDELEKVKESEPDFQAHQAKPVRETDEAKDSDEGEDFELHQLGAEKYKEKYKE